MRHFVLRGWATVDMTEDGDTTTVSMTDAAGGISVIVISGDAHAELTLDAPASSDGAVATAMELTAGAPAPKEE